MVNISLLSIFVGNFRLSLYPITRQSVRFPFYSLHLHWIHTFFDFFERIIKTAESKLRQAKRTVKTVKTLFSTAWLTLSHVCHQRRTEQKPAASESKIKIQSLHKTTRRRWILWRKRRRDGWREVNVKEMGGRGREEKEGKSERNKNGGRKTKNCPLWAWERLLLLFSMCISVSV